RIVSGPSDNSTGPVVFVLAANEPAVFQCSLDGVAYTACVTPVTYTGLAAGRHLFAARAVDAAGNVDRTPATYTWIVAKARSGAPTAQILTAPTGTQASSSAVVTFSGNADSITFECALDAALFLPCASPSALGGL